MLMKSVPRVYRDFRIVPAKDLVPVDRFGILSLYEANTSAAVRETVKTRLFILTGRSETFDRRPVLI